MDACVAGIVIMNSHPLGSFTRHKSLGQPLRCSESISREGTSWILSPAHLSVPASGNCLIGEKYALNIPTSVNQYIYNQSIWVTSSPWLYLLHKHKPAGNIVYLRWFLVFSINLQITWCLCRHGDSIAAKLQKERECFILWCWWVNGTIQNCIYLWMLILQPSGNFNISGISTQYKFLTHINLIWLEADRQVSGSWTWHRSSGLQSQFHCFFLSQVHGSPGYFIVKF